jgi:YesN/AraC family two-component response regulator
MFTVGYLSLQTPKTATQKSRLPRLSPQLSKVYKEKLLAHMQYDKPYLQGDLKLRDVADHLEITVHHLSELINTEMGVNFAEFINRYRIEEAVDLLDSDEGIMQIGYQVGFNNKTSFSQTFKKLTGYTPSQFRSLRSTSLAK